MREVHPIPRAFVAAGADSPEAYWSPSTGFLYAWHTPPAVVEREHLVAIRRRNPSEPWREAWSAEMVSNEEAGAPRCGCGHRIEQDALLYGDGLTCRGCQLKAVRAGATRREPVR